MAVATIEHQGYVITGNKQFPAMKRITVRNAGTVPMELRGIYTSFQAAKDHIDFLKSSKKSEPNAKADTTAGDEPVRAGNDNRGKPSKLPSTGDTV